MRFEGNTLRILSDNGEEELLAGYSLGGGLKVAVLDMDGDLVYATLTAKQARSVAAHLRALARMAEQNAKTFCAMRALPKDVVRARVSHTLSVKRDRAVRKSNRFMEQVG